MANTRRSTRHAMDRTPKYTENDSPQPGEETSKRNGKESTSRKRARNDDIEDLKDNASRPSKKSARSTSKSSKSANKAVAAPTPISSTNRTASSTQETYWLLKAEPFPRYENGINVAFSIDDLAACTAPEPWGGVRNPQARNNMQAMHAGDLGFFYHSNAKPSGVVGILRVANEAKIDETAFDPKDPYFDPKSEKEKPKWYCVSVEFVRKFEKVVDLHRIKSLAGQGGPLENMQLVRNGRLSVCRVSKEEWEIILGLAEGKEQEGPTDEEKTV